MYACMYIHMYVCKYNIYVGIYKREYSQVVFSYCEKYYLPIIPIPTYE